MLPSNENEQLMRIKSKPSANIQNVNSLITFEGDGYTGRHPRRQLSLQRRAVTDYNSTLTMTPPTSRSMLPGRDAATKKRVEKVETDCEIASLLDQRVEQFLIRSKADTQEIVTLKNKKALITGINGQVGSYLAELLLAKGYMVHGMIRRESSLNNHRLRHLFTDKVNRSHPNLKLHYGDLMDASSLTKLIATIKPHEIYNLAAQSHVKISFELPEVTGNTNALGTLRLLEAIRQHDERSIETDCYKTDRNKIKFYQASTSELFGGSFNHSPQSESTPFHPRSPYACAKLYAHSLVVNYRESYHMFAVNGILFNHESPRRGENFVTRKISRSVAEIKLGRRGFFSLGNLDAMRDWGHARDYVEAIWLMLQQDEPRDFVISSNETHSVREFVEVAFEVIGIKIAWSGEGINEVGRECPGGTLRIVVSEKFLRPSEVQVLLGDSSLARKQLKWKPKCTFKDLVKEMVLSDIALCKDPDA